MVERFHGTLNKLIAKIIESRGNWAEVVPMALYFIRCTPCEASGLSPFVLMHGWEPNTPLQLLYKSWVQQELGDIDLQEWVLKNTEKIDNLRDKAVDQYHTKSKRRKELWDEKSKERSFVVGDEVLLRKPGMGMKLQESWEGPYKVVRVNNPLSYNIDIEGRKKSSVHVQLLKHYIRRENDLLIKRVTMVLEPDTDENHIESTYSGVRILDTFDNINREKDIAEFESDFKETLTKAPGYCDMVHFDIDTGQHKPIQQRPYNTPIALRQSVDKEIDSLLQQGFISHSESPRASPMVTVRKPDGSARICIDFKEINKITESQPFYMPTVSEVLEAVGKAKVVSKIDHSKGYYQIPMKDSDIQKTAFVCHRGRYEFTRMHSE